MPVDEDINLDNPDGLTQDDLDRINEEGDKLEEVAIKAAKNAEIVKEAKKELEGLSFAQLNILDKAIDDRKFGEPKDLDDTIQTEKEKGGVAADMTMVTEMIVNILAEQEKAKEERKKNKDAAEKNAKEIKKAEAERKRIERENKKAIRDLEGGFDEVMGASSDPLSFAKGKIMGFVGKLGLAGVIVTVIYSMVNKFWKEYMKTFEAGGTNDIRKIMEDRDKEMMELNDILARRSGRVFFTGDVDLRQGAPQFSNTERLRDQVLRYQALHLGE